MAEEVVILGAGLTGLSTAYHLEQAHFFNYQLYEKEPLAGGLCRSVKQDGFTFDFTGHLLHINDLYFKEFIGNIFGFENMHCVNRKSVIYTHDTFLNYPFQMNLFGLPSDIIAECIEGFVTRKKLHTKQPSFLEWTAAHFGAGITKYFFEPYQSKIFACPLDDITASWTGRFVPQTSLNDIIKGALGKPKQMVGYNSEFFYPKAGGIYEWVKALIKKIEKPIHPNHFVESIDLKNKIVTFTNGNFRSYKTLISTLPLDVFLQLLKEPTSSSLKKAGQKLRCNSVLNFNLGINRKNLSDKHWIYLPEKEFPQYRMGFYTNLCPAMGPPETTGLYGEIAYFQKDKHKLAEQIQQAVKKTQELLHFDESEIVTQKIIQIDRAYVTYDFWRERNLPKLLQRLTENNIYSIGRYGGWKYNSMQEAILEGKKMAERLSSSPFLRYTKSKSVNP